MQNMALVYDVYRRYFLLYILLCVFGIMPLSEPCSVFFGVAKSCGSIVAVRVERLPWHYHEVVMLSRLVVEHSEAVKSVPLCWPQNITEAKTLCVFALFWHGISIFWSQPRLSWKWYIYMSTGWLGAIDGAGPAPKEIRFIRPKVPKRSRDLWWCANQCHTLIVTVGLGGNNFPAAIISTICPKLWLHSAFPSEGSHPMPFRDLLSWTRGYWDPHFFHPIPLYQNCSHG